MLMISCELTYHCVHGDKSIPVSALHVRMAVFISTDGSFSGFNPSRDGDQAPPIAIVSFFPEIPTKKLINRDGCTKSSRSFSSAEAKHFRYISAIGGISINITYNYMLITERNDLHFY